MKRLLPLLFLVPSVALILYAKRDADSDAVPTYCDVRVEVDTGGFEFPADVGLVVSYAESSTAAVEDGAANVRIEQPGRVTMRLHLSHVPEGKAGWTLPGVGKPREFELNSLAESPSWTLTATADECRAALNALGRRR